MDCVNHSGVTATAYCQNCGKGLCADCITAGAMRTIPGGQVLCDGCIAAWQSLQPPFAGLNPSGPNPSAAAVLGVIPGVGAMYNGQFLKGFIHVIVFAALVTLTSTVHGDLDIFFGLLIPAWILYQSFEAYHTAKALREGQPPPDPLRLNELGDWLNLGGRPRNPGQPVAWAGAAEAGAAGQAPPVSGPPPPYRSPYQAPYAPPPVCCGSRAPIGAIVLIGLGILFLLGKLDIFHGRLFEFAWPLGLIALGVWLIVRHFGEQQGGCK